MAMQLHLIGSDHVMRLMIDQMREIELKRFKKDINEIASRLNVYYPSDPHARTVSKVEIESFLKNPTERLIKTTERLKAIALVRGNIHEAECKSLTFYIEKFHYEKIGLILLHIERNIMYFHKGFVWGSFVWTDAMKNDFKRILIHNDGDQLFDDVKFKNGWDAVDQALQTKPNTYCTVFRQYTTLNNPSPERQLQRYKKVAETLPLTPFTNQVYRKAREKQDADKNKSLNEQFILDVVAYFYVYSVQKYHAIFVEQFVRGSSWDSSLCQLQEEHVFLPALRLLVPVQAMINSLLLSSFNKASLLTFKEDRRSKYMPHIHPRYEYVIKHVFQAIESRNYRTEDLINGGFVKDYLRRLREHAMLPASADLASMEKKLDDTIDILHILVMSIKCNILAYSFNLKIFFYHNRMELWLLTTTLVSMRAQVRRPIHYKYCGTNKFLPISFEFTRD